MHLIEYRSTRGDLFLFVYFPVKFVRSFAIFIFCLFVFDDVFVDVFGFLYYCCLLIVISVVCQNSLHSYFF